MEQRAFLDEAIANSGNPKVQSIYMEIKQLYEKRLWHNLTLKLVELVETIDAGDPQLLELYHNFIKGFEGKLNQLTLAKLAVVISKAYTNTGEAQAFLEGLAEKQGLPDGNLEAHLLLRAIILLLKLKEPQVNIEVKRLLDDIRTKLEGVTGIDNVVYSNYYRAEAEYYKIRDLPTNFYKYALLFLSFTPLETLNEKERQRIAYDVGISALVGEDIYNFGDLLEHPIVDSLINTDNEWLAHLLRAFYRGDIDKYEELVNNYQERLSREQLLVQRTELLKEKISILCLMGLVFNRQSISRLIPFTLIAETTKLPLELVEILVMKALSLKLIKGTIDQVDQHVIVTWVQPRVLQLDQIVQMKDRLDDWSKTVHNTLIGVEQFVCHD